MRSLLLSLVSFSLCIAVVVSRATPATAEGLVLESYVGQRPADAGRVVKLLLEELTRRDYVSSGAMIQFESRVSKPAQTEVGLQTDQFIQQVEKGHRAWISGNFNEALQTLQPLVQKAHENPGAFAQNQQQLRERLFKALMGIAVSQLKIGDTGSAKGTFNEILRSFPDQPVSRSVYGADVADAYEAAKKELGAKRGGLIVTLTGESGPIFINEKFDNVGKVTKTDMYPGEYRVFAQPAKGLTRSHRVTINPGETVNLVIDTGFDLAVQAKSDWVGFTFASAEDRADNEALYATKFAKAIGKDSVIVVSVDQANGRPVLVAAIVDMVGRKDLRRASIALDPTPAPRTVVGLAKFLTSGEEAEGVQVQVARKGPPSGGGSDPGNETRPEVPSTGGGLWGGWKWMTGFVALGGLGVGGYLVATDGECTERAAMMPNGMPGQCLFNRENTIAGWATLAGGAVMAGITIYLFVRSDGSEPTRTGYVVPTRGGAMAGYSVRF